METKLTRIAQIAKERHITKVSYFRTKRLSARYITFMLSNALFYASWKVELSYWTKKQQ